MQTSELDQFSIIPTDLHQSFAFSLRLCQPANLLLFFSRIESEYRVSLSCVSANPTHQPQPHDSFPHVPKDNTSPQRQQYYHPILHFDVIVSRHPFLTLS